MQARATLLIFACGALVASCSSSSGPVRSLPLAGRGCVTRLAGTAPLVTLECTDAPLASPIRLAGGRSGTVWLSANSVSLVLGDGGQAWSRPITPVSPGAWGGLALRVASDGTIQVVVPEPVGTSLRTFDPQGQPLGARPLDLHRVVSAAPVENGEWLVVEARSPTNEAIVAKLDAQGAVRWKTPIAGRARHGVGSAIGAMTANGDALVLHDDRGLGSETMTFVGADGSRARTGLPAYPAATSFAPEEVFGSPAGAAVVSVGRAGHRVDSFDSQGNHRARRDLDDLHYGVHGAMNPWGELAIVANAESPVHIDNVRLVPASRSSGVLIVLGFDLKIRWAALLETGDRNDIVDIEGVAFGRDETWHVAGQVRTGVTITPYSQTARTTRSFVARFGR